MVLLDVADWREKVARLYLSEVDLMGFRRGRDELFASHPQSPIPAQDRSTFTGLRYYPPDPQYVVQAPLEKVDGSIEIDTGTTDGTLTYRRVAVARTAFGPLTLWWIQAYGGGLFLPFRDETCGKHTYGGGRYLTDTVKGTFGRGVTVLSPDLVRLDFNYAYNPSCAYSPQWSCPLAPPENRLAAAIPAGEKSYVARS